MHADLVRYVVANLRSRQMRSWLTILGIVIGITAIVTLIAVGQGLDASIKKEIEGFGSDTVIVTPRISIGISGPPTRSGLITLNDMEEVKRTPGIDPSSVTSTVGDRMSLSYKDQNITTTVVGVDTRAFAKTFGNLLKIEQGRLLKAGDSKVVLLSHDQAKDAFREEILLNSQIKIGGDSFRVIGILKSAGGGLTSGEPQVYIPQEDARIILGDKFGPRQITSVWSRVMPGQSAPEVAKRLDKRLMEKRKVTEKTRNFSVLTSESIQQQVGTITGLLTLFLGGIAAISLVVGGVGVANTMFMSVMERTREIGLMKAVGAKRNAIMEVFIIESCLISAIGGIIGIVIGLLISFVLNMLGAPSAISPELAGFGMLFAVSVGAISGYFPAKRAAELVAVEALRYE
ncbi:MAG: ABC transporter permease [Candidatus Micrarchaeia archaeon]|jgi:putative ABC transport system permease protein